MKFDYKKLGNLIEISETKNKDLTVTKLVGMNIHKEFIPSVANTIGTNLARYKLINENQFACNLMHVGRDKSVVISLFTSKKPTIISPAYKVFEIKNKEMILPKFLMMYFRRSEFDRLGWFYTDSSIRGSLDWAKFCDIKIPIPTLEIQEKIVKIYEFLNYRIKLKERINKNLMDIANGIFKKEFLNFEEYDNNNLNSSEFGLIPKKWFYVSLDKISDVTIGKTPPRKEPQWFSETNGIKWISIKDLGKSEVYVFETSEYLTEEAIYKFNVKLIPKDTVILSFKLTVGRLGITTEKMVTNEAIAHFKLNNDLITTEYLYLYLKNFNYESLGSTSSIAKAINSKIVKKIPILIPSKEKLNSVSILFNSIFEQIKINQGEISKLTKLRDILLPKLMSGEIDVSKINYGRQIGRASCRERV